MDAIESGADGLAHAFAFGGESIDPRFVPLVAERRAFVIPTFSVLESVCNESPGQHLLDDPKLSSYEGADYLPQLKKNRPGQMPEILRRHRAFRGTAN